MAFHVGRETIKWFASLGSGTLTALAVGVLVEIGLDPTRPLGGAIAVAVGTLAVKFVGWATAKYGPQPAKPVSARRVRRSNGGGPITMNPQDLPPTG